MIHQLGTCLTVVLATVAGFALAAEDQPTYTDPALAGRDFAIQGEYLGKVSTDEGQVNYGVQVIARGFGKFDVVAYPGGLPGAKGDVSKKIRATGATVDGVTTFISEDGRATGTIRDNVLAIESATGEQLGSLKKVDRVSPTAKAEPPAGAIVLFDGSGTEHFVDGKMTKCGLLEVGTESKKKFQDFQFHLEFRSKRASEPLLTSGLF